MIQMQFSARDDFTFHGFSLKIEDEEFFDERKFPTFQSISVCEKVSGEKEEAALRSSCAYTQSKSSVHLQ
jgi:hypothetical protein